MPPGTGSRSHTVTSAPTPASRAARITAQAAESPESPPPITITRFMVVSAGTSEPKDFCGPFSIASLAPP
ncbi:MAG: hypothetical protein Kow0054_11690 [Deferrisoma sp.]